MPVSRRTRQRLSAHKQRKAANIRKNPHPYKDGLGKERAAWAKLRSWGLEEAASPFAKEAA